MSSHSARSNSNSRKRAEPSAAISRSIGGTTAVLHLGGQFVETGCRVLRVGLLDDVRLEDIEVACRAEKIGDPFQFLREGSGFLIAREWFEEGERRPQAADGDPRLVHGFGFVRIVQQPLVEKEVFQTSAAIVCRATPAGMPGRRRIDPAFSAVPAPLNEPVAALAFADEIEMQGDVGAETARGLVERRYVAAFQFQFDFAEIGRRSGGQILPRSSEISSSAESKWIVQMLRSTATSNSVPADP